MSGFLHLCQPAIVKPLVCPNASRTVFTCSGHLTCEPSGKLFGSQGCPTMQRMGEGTPESGSLLEKNRPVTHTEPSGGQMIADDAPGLRPFPPRRGQAECRSAAPTPRRCPRSCLGVVQCWQAKRTREGSRDRFHRQKIRLRGTDMIEPFTFSGTLGEAGQVVTVWGCAQSR